MIIKNGWWAFTYEVFFILYKGIPERALHGIVTFLRDLLFFRDPDTKR